MSHVFTFALLPHVSTFALFAFSLSKANKYSADELALMRSQDVNYLTLKRQVESEVSASFSRVFLSCSTAHYK
jgi:hypothetical protein